jgi:hypothetical protein
VSAELPAISGFSTGKFSITAWLIEFLILAILSWIESKLRRIF